MVATAEWLNDQLIRSVRRRAYMPTNDATFSPADMLEVGNEEMRDYVLPFLREVHEEFLIRTVDISVAAGVTDVRIPIRCAGEALKAVMYDAGGGNFMPLDRIEPQLAGSNNTAGAGQTYYLEDDRVVLSPAPANVTTLRLKYVYRPGRLVLAADCVPITSVVGVTITPGASASVGSRFTDGAAVDIIAGQPGLRTLALDLIATTAVGATMTISGTIPSTVAAGDYVCLAGESPFPQIPVEAWGLLAQRMAVKMLEGKGSENYDKAMGELEGTAMAPGGLRGRVLSMLSNRTETSAEFVQNYDAPGWSTGLRGRRYP